MSSRPFSLTRADAIKAHNCLRMLIELVEASELDALAPRARSLVRRLEGVVTALEALTSGFHTLNDRFV